MVTLCAVIPATDARDTSDRCIRAVREAEHPPEEIIVVNRPRRLGPAAARNRGARQATADVLVFVDSDIEVHADAFVKIRKAFAEDPGLAGVFGSYDDNPASGGLVSGFRNLLHHYVHQSAAGQASTFWAGLGSIRRDVFLRAGGFDEKRFLAPSVEDIELGMRLVSSGNRILLDPTILGQHHKRWTLGSMIRTDLLRRGVPWVQLLLQRDVASTTLNLGWRHRASAAASAGCLVGVLTRKPKVAAASLAVVICLNTEFYALLYKKRGLRQTAAGPPLHVLHHLVSVVAVPIGIFQHLRRKSP